MEFLGQKPEALSTEARSLVFVSWYATSRQFGSHWYWTYRTLLAHSTSTSKPIVLARRGNKSSDGLIATLDRFGFQASFRPASRRYVKRAVENIGKQLSSDRPIFVFYEGGFRELQIALALLFANVDSRIVFNFYNIQIWNHVLNHADLKFFKVLRSAEDTGRIKFACELPSLLNLGRQDSSLNIERFPVFAPSLTSRQSNILKSTDQIVIFESGWKNASAVVTLIEHLRQMGRGNITLITSNSDLVKRLRKKSEGQRSSPPLVIAKTLGAGEYETLLAKSKTALFLYNPAKYRSKTSGKLEEAIAAGCHCIVPRETGLEIQNGRKLESFANLSSEEIYSKLPRLRGPQKGSVDPVDVNHFYSWVENIHWGSSRANEPDAKVINLGKNSVPRTAKRLAPGDWLNRIAVLCSLDLLVAKIRDGLRSGY